MKKLIIVGFLAVALNAYACQIYTIMVNGKPVNCTICQGVVNCY